MKTFHSALITFCIAGVMCLVVPKAHAVDIVVNGGFESGAFAPGWTLTDPDPMGTLSNVGSNPTFAHSGIYHANLGTASPSASLTQTLATTFPGLITLSYWLAHDVTPAGPPVSNMFQVFFGGVLVPGSTLVNVGTFGYTQFTFTNLIATGGSTSLEFRFTDGNDFFRLDDVSVNVPESGATALLALPTFAGLLLAYPRRRAKKSGLS